MNEPLEMTLDVTGMSCASCIRRVEKAALAVGGVSAATANLAAETLQVTGGAGFDAGRLAQALEVAGYPLRHATARFAISEMSCASCVGRVEKALRAVPGVLSAEVNLASEAAVVTYAAHAVTPARIAEAAGAAGYPARWLDAPATAGDAAEGAGATTAGRKEREAAQLWRATLCAALLAAPVFLLEMGGHLFPAFHHWVAMTLGEQTSRVIQFVLATAVLAGPGRMFFAKGYRALFRLAPEMNSLVALGTSAAWGYSVVATFAPGLLPEGARHVYFEAAVVIVVLILAGRAMEARARGRTGAAIARLVGLQPRSARVERDGATLELPLAELRVGDVFVLRPGEKVATDGEVLEGSSFLDESMITGEPAPVAKAAGDPVTGGTVNRNGVLRLRATRVGGDTALAQIVRLVEQAQGARLPIQGLVDRVTAWFVPAVLGVAVLAVAVWLVLGAGLSQALVAGVAVLIIACPCAMGLATPTSIMVGSGRAAELGVLFRKGDALQALSGMKVVAFDKTGTLTEGAPALTDLVVVAGEDEAALLRLAAAAEAGSEHPIAVAILDAARARGLTLPAAREVEALTGEGLRAQVEEKAVLIGAERMLAARGIVTGDLAAAAARIAAAGRSPVYLAVEGRALAVFGVSDPLKPATPQAVAALKAAGLAVAMITGDNRATAEAIAREAGIDRVVAEVLPEGKVAALEALRAEFGPVAFVGDGINDAPALARADVGIAIGTGTDVAVESADVVLMSGDPAGVLNAFAISRRTLANIRQNLVWAFGYNVVLIPVAAGALYPGFGLMLSPMLGAAAMALSSVFVLSNALRLRFVRPEIAPAPTGNPKPGVLAGQGNLVEARG